MIKIGDFSKLGHVTAKTLHHYDQVGLLKPAHIDRFTGYRYYTLAQLPRLNRILALKDLGFSLDQAAQMMDENLSAAKIRGMLRVKQAELAERVEVEGARLARVERRLQEIELEGNQPGQDIAIKEVGPQVVLSARGMAASESAILPELEKLQALLQSSLDQAHMKPTGPWFVLMDDLPYIENELELELAVPVKPARRRRMGDWQGSPISLRELSAVGAMASMIHEGEYAAINQAYTHLFAWCQANAFKIAGSFREVYLTKTGINSTLAPDTHSGFTEVQCPVERASVPVSIRTPESNLKENNMKPKFVSKPAMTVVGMSYVGKNENQDISQLWGEYLPREKEIEHKTGQCNYGACFSQPEGATEGEFEYVACYEVTDASTLPEGMVVRQVPAHKYAVFTHKGKVNTLGETYKYIFETWLPQSDVELHPDKFDMELYDDRFIPDSDESELDILVAIKD